MRAIARSRGTWLALVLLACGTTRRSPTEELGEGGAPSPPRGGSAAGGFVSGGSNAGGSGALTGGSAGLGAEGGEGAADTGGAPASSPCIDGALCHCEDAAGVLKCGDAESAEAGECVCPSPSACEAPTGRCFEPCGGDPTGFWVAEEVCLRGSGAGRCAGSSVAGSSLPSTLKLQVYEDTSVTLLGGQELEVLAQVPLTCLGIESVHRCVDADFYASPFFFQSSPALSCEANACGGCDCSGVLHESGGGRRPWQAGAETLPFGDIDVPYCVEGDTMWAGGGDVAGEPKAAYKLRRHSCVGKPLPCAERNEAECNGSDECLPGQCLPVEGGSELELCSGLAPESCEYLTACQWVPGGCWGEPGDSCTNARCDSTPGCSWGPPQRRCGGEPRSCYGRPASQCTAPGCSVRTCDVPDGWSGIDKPSCAPLSASACSKAAGCAWSGGACKGFTTCGSQSDPTICAALECEIYATPTCGGYPTTPCAEVSVEDCRDQPGCHIEW